jgi:hypothetical protein
MYPTAADALIYCNPWRHPGWQDAVGLEQSLVDGNDRYQALRTVIGNCSNLSEVHLLVNGKSSTLFSEDLKAARAQHSREANALLKRRGVWSKVAQFMSDHAIDPVHVTRATGERAPKNGADYYGLKVPQLATLLLGSTVFVPGLGSIERKTQQLMILFMYQTWYTQCKQLQRATDRFDELGAAMEKAWTGKQHLL